MEFKILKRYIKYKIQIFVLRNKNIQNYIFAEYSHFKNLLYFPTAPENLKKFTAQQDDYSTFKQNSQRIETHKYNILE